MTREHYSSDHHELVGVELGNVSPDEDEPRYAIKRLSPGDVPQELRELPSSIQHYTDEGTGFCIFDPPSQNVVQSTNVENSNNVHVGNVTVINNGVNIYRDLRSPSPHNVPNLTDTCNGSLKKAQQVSKDTLLKKPKDLKDIIKNKSFRMLCVIMVLLIATGLSLVTYYWTHYSLDPSDTDSQTVGHVDDLGDGIQLIQRSEWLARDPLNVTKITSPLNIVRIMHTAGTPCSDYQHCAKGVLAMQGWQVASQGMPDLAYNYMIGGDGNVYVGRGPDVVNEWMPRAIDVAYMGNFLTPYDQLTNKMELAGKRLIQLLAQQGYITPDYVVIPHNQTFNTLSPGQNIYKKMIKWPHYDSSLYF